MHEGPKLEHGTWLHFLYTKLGLPHWVPEALPVTWFVVVVLTIAAVLAGRKRDRIPGPFQNFMEYAVSALDNFTIGIVGTKGADLSPFIGTFFIFILVLNLIGIVPGFISPTSNINTTLALALVAFVAVHYYGIREVGLRNYLMHFVGEPVLLAPLMIPIHVVGELARPLSLSIRLFGNMFGEDMVIAILILIATTVLKVVWIPLQFPMLLFAIFTSFVQALVFAMLVCIYIAVAFGDHSAEHH